MKVVLVAFLKNEDRYILEHYIWYKNLGVTDFVYIYNDCTDASENILTFLSETQKTVTIFHNKIKSDDVPQRVGAFKIFSTLINEYFNEYVLCVDLDEFLLLKKHNSIQDLVNEYECPDVISFNWRVFGSSEKKSFEPLPVTCRFKRCSHPLFPLNKEMKSLWRLNDNISGFGAHRPFLKDTDCNRIAWIVPSEKYSHGYSVLESFRNGEKTGLDRDAIIDVAQVNHYAVKSSEEYSNRQKRGRGLANTTGKKRHTEKYFRMMNKNIIYDQSACQKFSLLDAQYEQLNLQFINFCLDLPPQIEVALFFADQRKYNIAEKILLNGLNSYTEKNDSFGHPVFKKELMRLYLKQQRWDDAKKLIPNKGDIGGCHWHENLFARAYDKAGDEKSAELWWRKYLQYKPDDKEAINWVNSNIKGNENLPSIFINNSKDFHYEVIESIIENLFAIFGKKHYEFKCIYLNIPVKRDKVVQYFKSRYPNIRFSSFELMYCEFYVECTIYNRDIRHISNFRGFKSAFVAHEVTPELISLSNVWFLTPLCGIDRWFYASHLPFNKEKKMAKKPVYIVQGNMTDKRRNFKLLQCLFENDYDYEIRLVGRGKLPKELENYATDSRLSTHFNLNFTDFHRQFIDAYCIIPLVDPINTPQYYKNKLTSSVSYGLGYGLHFLVEKVFAKKYSMDLSREFVYSNDDEFVSAFNKSLVDFYSAT
ncbi:hypothetical protein D5085_02115 [Ectothiorhodospiraceae bacterium BW-2]|nr:hypothetical protein D5085_02115 [Ectothiorhodospiraceae bacterium BW-2]